MKHLKNNMTAIARSLSLAAMAIFLTGVCTPVLADAPPMKPATIQEKLAQLEVSVGGRIGISAINTANNTQLQYRAEERFPFCSTAKVMVVSAILKQSMTDSHFLQQKIMYKKEDLVVYSPITEKHLDEGMTISELGAATMTQSDNTAMNLLVKKLGGLKTITTFAHSIGDNAFRLDRWEPELNSAIPGDLRDTTTPAAMEKSLQQLAFGNALASPQREQLQTWLKNNTTGNFRIRAGVPKDWLVGDKTGTGDYGTTNDIGIIWPPKCSPIVVAIYFTQSKKEATPRNDVIASAMQMLINEFAHTDQCIKLKSS